MNKIFLLSVLVFSLFGSPGFSDDFDTQAKNFSVRWCRDIATLIEAALATGEQADTFAEEVQILTRAARQALAQATRHHYSFSYTLQSALSDSAYYKDDEAKAYLLRRYLENALYDVFVIDRSHYDRDYGPYVTELLARGRDEGERAPHDSEEIMFLTTTLQRAKSLLEVSEYSRTGPYACAVLAIKQALDISSNLALSPFTRVHVLRQGIERAIEKLTYPSCR